MTEQSKYVKVQREDELAKAQSEDVPLVVIRAPRAKSKADHELFYIEVPAANVAITLTLHEIAPDQEQTDEEFISEQTGGPC